MAYLAVASLSATIWLYLLVGRGSFWKIWRLFSSEINPQPVRVVAVMPARDEADVIAESIHSLMRQELAGSLHVVVVDDASSDATGEIARQTGASVITGKPLQAGWTGKLWALSQGVAFAETLQPDYLLFTDADIRHGSSTVAQLVALSAARKLDLASYMVKLHCQTVPEKLLIPPFVFFFLKLYPPAWIESKKLSTAGAAGGCVLIRPAMLRAIGGLDAIRGEIIDDCSLARTVKRQGGSLWLGLTAESESIRPYGRFQEIGQMISRSAFKQLDHSGLLLAGAVAGLLVTYLAPVCLIFCGNALAASVAAASYLVMSATYLPMVRFYKLPAWYCLSLPFAALFYLGATVHSATQFWRGRGGVWKGRVQDHSAH